MANIFDYLTWRADVPFEVDPFNVVDNIVLSELVYSPFDGIIPGPGVKNKITIEEACDLFFSKFSEEELKGRATLTKYAPFLMQKMAKSKRYGGMKLSGFVNEVDPEGQSQFAACAFYLPDGTIFVAYRGTDDSLVGWKEDYNLCFSDGTGGQIKAVNYLNTNFSRTMKPIRLGGHSKGGNFAVYAGAFCRPHMKDNLLDIYNNDGPGFIPEIIKSDKYKSVLKRIHRIIPNESIIGMLMYDKAKTIIVKSDNKGINQHDMMSWQIERNYLVEAEELAASSIKIDEIMKKWTKQFDYDTREAFGNIFFSSLYASGATKMSDITSKRIRSVASITKEIQALEPQNQVIVLDVFKALVAVGGDTLKSSLISKLPKSVIMRKNEN